MGKIVPIINNNLSSDEIQNLQIRFSNVSISKTKPIINDNSFSTEIRNNKYLQVFDMGEGGGIGATGNGIYEIKKTNTEDLVDTYTIFYTNGTTSEFKVTNGRDAPIYSGPYTVTSSIYNQSLSTNQTYMNDNIKINKIPYYEVSNLSGGKTASIGDI